MLRIILSTAVSYLIGSIPFVYLLGKIFKGADIRDSGSGNIGATNAFRVFGPGIGVSALFCDILKGFVCPTLIADYLAQADTLYRGLVLRIILGLCAVIGHNWTFLLKFRGGKGVATSLGVILGLAVIVPALRIVLILSILIWLVIFLSSGFVSLSSIVSAIFFPILLFIFNSPSELFITGIALAIFIIFRHNSNIYRLLRKEEHRFDPLKPLKKFSSKRPK